VFHLILLWLLLPLLMVLNVCLSLWLDTYRSHAGLLESKASNTKTSKECSGRAELSIPRWDQVEFMRFELFIDTLSSIVVDVSWGFEIGRIVVDDRDR
jgi:hypothetical protein